MAESSITLGSLKVATVAAFLLTFLTWIYFYKAIPDAPPLGAPETTIVFGTWFGLVFSLNWIWRRVCAFAERRPK